MTPYGVDNAWFARESESRRARRGEIRRTWGIPADAFVFLFSGKLIPKKRPADIVKALAEVGRRSLPPAPCHLLVAGDGGMKDECERMARVLNVPATFAGFLNQRDMPDAYAASDCLVLPSDNGETWGLVVNEAMASGLPAIVSDQVGCHPDLIVPGRTGFVFPCGDVTALARCLGAMASDPRMCRDMGQAAQACVEACSVEAVVDGVMAALRHVKSERVAR
jgi:glycosyltransferase involved in cell wall biosynthesis